MGKTTGRGKDDQTHKPNRTIKDVLGLPLTADFRERRWDEQNIGGIAHSGAIRWGTVSDRRSDP